MLFKDFDKFYNEVFPKITPVTSKVETTTGEKDISEEHKEVFVDETWVEKPTTQEPTEDVVESADDGSIGTDKGTSE